MVQPAAAHVYHVTHPNASPYFVLSEPQGLTTKRVVLVGSPIGRRARIVVKKNPVPRILEICIVLSVILIFAGQMVFWVELDRALKVVDISTMWVSMCALLMSTAKPTDAVSGLMFSGILCLIFTSFVAARRYNVMSTKYATSLSTLFFGILGVRLLEWTYRGMNEHSPRIVYSNGMVEFKGVEKNFNLYVAFLVLVSGATIYSSLKGKLFSKRILCGGRLVVYVFKFFVGIAIFADSFALVIAAAARNAIAGVAMTSVSLSIFGIVWCIYSGLKVIKGDKKKREEHEQLLI